MFENYLANNKSNIYITNISYKDKKLNIVTPNGEKNKEKLFYYQYHFLYLIQFQKKIYYYMKL